MELALDSFDLPPTEVRHRFEWASRQGQPNWLWPSLPVERWQRALTDLECVLRCVLSGEPPQPLRGDPEAIGVACYTSGVGPLLGLWVEQGLVSASPSVGALLRLHLRHNRLRMQQMTGRAVALAAAFAAHGIELTLLKGMHTAHAYFPEPGTRPLSDIDALVDRSDLPAANRLLEGAGYQPGKTSRWPPQRAWLPPLTSREPRSLCFVHAEDPWAIDLQTSLDRRYSAGAPLIRLDSAMAEPKAEHWPVSNEARVLRQPLLLLQLAVHASCGLESLTLLRLVELVLVIRRDVSEGRLSWPDFVRAAERAGALGVVYPALRLCEQLVPGTVPAEVWAECQQHAPPAVRRVVDPLRPANAQRVVRCSLGERFMWTSSRTDLVRQVVMELVPPGVSSPFALLAIYRTRAWRLLRQTLTP